MRTLSTTGIATLALLLGVTGLSGISALSCKDPVKRRSRRAAARDRKVRQTPVATLAPASPPASIPLLGKAGTDPDGYPQRWVDRRGFRSLLWHNKYADLTRYFEQFQRDFEKDCRKARWISDAAQAFSSAEPTLRKRLDAWVAASPRSFAPYLARGTHLVAAGYARRGAKFAHKTHRDNFAAMELTMAAAHKDLDRALSLRPQLVEALKRKISAYTATSHHALARKAVGQALQKCPACFEVRWRYLFALTPRWGGSYPAMSAFATHKITPKLLQKNPRLRVLPGLVAVDKARGLLRAKRYREALTAIAPAFALGNHWYFYEVRARIRYRQKDYPAAVTDLATGLNLRPGTPDLLFLRSKVYFRQRQWEAAGRDLLTALQQEPTASRGRRWKEPIVKGLVYQGWQDHQAGKKASALRLLDLAAELDPKNRDVQRRRSFMVSGRGRPAESKLQRLRAAARKAPDDFRTLQRLDYALARLRRFKEVVRLWTDFLTRHPKHGRAYLERGGAYYHLRQLNKAQSDARRACTLGISEGCVRAKQLRRLLKRR